MYKRQLKSVAVQVLLEISVYLRETHQLLPKPMPHVVGPSGRNTNASSANYQHHNEVGFTAGHANVGPRHSGTGMGVRWRGDDGRVSLCDTKSPHDIAAENSQLLEQCTGSEVASTNSIAEVGVGSATGLFSVVR